MPATTLILEMVPPLLSDQPTGLAQRMATIEQIRASVSLSAINIPEIHPESAHHRKGARRQPFAPHMPPRDFAREIQTHCDLPCIVNHVVVHQPVDALAQWLQTAVERFDIHRFVLVGGEDHDIDYPGPPVCEANALARRLFPESSVELGNICIPARAGETQRTQKKLAAGADFFTTQIIYEPKELTSLNRISSGLRPTPPIYVSFAPIKSEQSLRFLNWLGVNVSPALEARLLNGAHPPLATSIQHLVDSWSSFIATTPEVTPHINLCPIGNIPTGAMIELAQGLLQATPSASADAGY